MPSQWFARKSLQAIQADSADGGGFKRTLSTVDLVCLGLGVAVGSGIFVLTGHAAAHNAGPAVALAYGLAALGAGLGSLCYAEMASVLPVAGSAYSYAYATLGQGVAFLLGWDLTLEYLVGACTVAAGWSGYANALWHTLTGIRLPPHWCHAPLGYDPHGRGLRLTGHYVNLPAVLILLALTAVLVRGVRGSSRVNVALVAVKTSAVVLFVCFCARFVKPANWQPFVPSNTGVFGAFGFSGVLQAASLVFFSYLGIDNLTTAALETRDPQRSLPRAIIWTLLLCTLLYVGFSLVLTGVVPYAHLKGDHPASLATAVTGIAWLQTLVEVGAVAGLTSVILVQLYGQPRILYAMAKDGLLPPVCGRVHRRFGTPHINTVGAGVLCAAGAGALPVDFLAELCSIGTLFAFILVSLGVIVLRLREPHLPRRFRVPFGLTLPIASVIVCVILMRSVSATTLMRLAVWLICGVVVYSIYGKRHAHTVALSTVSTRPAKPIRAAVGC